MRFSDHSYQHGWRLFLDGLERGNLAIMHLGMRIMAADARQKGAT